MSRLSREKKREDQRTARSEVPMAPAPAPLDVRVPAAGPGAGGATIGGVPVVPDPGEEVQHAVLRHLHRIALATGHPVLAVVRDDRIGYAVPLRVDLDGSSHFTGEPAATAPPEDAVPTTPQAAPAAAPASPPPAWRQEDAAPPRSQPASQPLPQPLPDAEPSPESRLDDPAPTFRLRTVRESATDTPYGTAAAPMGEFGPPPTMDGPPSPAPTAAPASAPVSPAFGPPSVVTPEPHPELHPEPDPYAVPEPAPDPKATPARGFDAVAEAVLGDEPLGASGAGDTPALLAEPMARISDAVKSGQIEEAAALAERTVAEASRSLGPEHPEVLRLLELTAYIAYLAGDPLRAFHLSLDLARVCHRAGDAEAAYGNVQSAAAAWRAVRDPAQGLRLGQDLLGLWTDLTGEDGPAADDIGQLESARARMNRLAERAARDTDTR